MAGRPQHQPDEKSRKFVEAMSAAGLTQEEIGRIVGISDPTLRKHYAKELATAAAKANAMVGESLLNQAIGGPGRNWKQASTAAAIWWSKTRMGWKEPPTELKHTGDQNNPVVQRIERVIVDPQNSDSESVFPAPAAG